MKELILYANDLFKVKHFYDGVLNFTIAFEKKNEIGFFIGESLLIFRYRNQDIPSYHFAINVPSNMENEVLDWLGKRTDLLSFEGKPIIDFVNWNAKAVYCLDYNNNVVEFIARKNLNINETGKFEAGLALALSEIGLVCTTIKEVYNRFNTSCALQIYHGDFLGFCAIGDEEGLFIVVDPSKKYWFPTKILAQPIDFKLKMEKGAVKYEVEYINNKLKIIEL